MQLGTQYQSYPVLDSERLKRATMEDQDLIREVVAGFSKDMSTMLQELSSCVDSLPHEIILARLHKMKGAAGNVGGKRLEALLKTMNEAVQSGGETVDIPNIQVLNSEYESLISELTRSFC